MIFALLVCLVLGACEKSTSELQVSIQTEDNRNLSGELEDLVPMATAPPCNCRIISKGSFYNVNVCGQGVSSVPCSMSPCPGSGSTRNLYPGSENFLVSSGATFQLTNTGTSSFAGSVRCQTGNSAGLSYPVSLAPGEKLTSIPILLPVRWGAWLVFKKLSFRSYLLD